MKEELKDYMNSDEGKQIFTELFNAEIERAGYKKPEEIDGLVKKNRELLGEIKKIKELKNDNPLLTKLEKYAIYNEEDLENAFNSVSNKKGEADEKERALRKLERELELERKQREQYQKSAEDIKQRYFQSEKQKSILSLLSQSGIDEEQFDVLSVYFDRLTQIEEDPDGNIALIADDGAQSLPLSDYITQWSKTDKAKHYIKAKNNAGAGTISAGARTSGKMTLEQIQALPDRKQRYEAMRENGFLQT